MVWPKDHSGANRQIGATQLELLRLAAGQPGGQVIIDPVRHNRQWCAMKRMVRRGLFDRYLFGSQVIGVLTVYQLTDAGRAKLAEHDAKVR